MSSTRCGGVGPSNGQSHAVATMTSTDVAAVVCDGDDVSDQRGRPPRSTGRRWRGCARRPPTPRTRWTEGPPRRRAWRRWGWPPARRTRCRDPGSWRARRPVRRRRPARAPSMGETNAVASTSRTPVATIASSIFELVRQRDRVLDLQTVTQCDFADVHVSRQFGQITPSSRKCSNSLSVLPSSPR